MSNKGVVWSITIALSLSIWMIILNLFNVTNLKWITVASPILTVFSFWLIAVIIYILKNWRKI